MQTLWWSQQHFAFWYLPSQQTLKLSLASISCIIKGSVKIQECFSAQGWDAYLPSRSGPSLLWAGCRGLIRAGRGWSQAESGEMITRPHFMQTSVICNINVPRWWRNGCTFQRLWGRVWINYSGLFRGIIFEHRRILKNHLSWILNMKEYVKEILYGQ